MALLGDRREAYRILVSISERKDHVEHPDIDGSVMLKRIFK